MKKMLMLMIIVGSSALVTGCGFGNCGGGGSCCTTCNVSYSSGCCGSNGWY